MQKLATRRSFNCTGLPYARGFDGGDKRRLAGGTSMMFVPPYSLIRQHIRMTDKSVEGDEQLSVPRHLFEFILRCLLDGVDFDEDQYQQCNPDVKEAVQRRLFGSGREHFIQVGYFEGRTGGIPVHETWYLARNPDVAAAKQQGFIESAGEQYRLAGASEWREPNPEATRYVRAWRELLLQ